MTYTEVFEITYNSISKQPISCLLKIKARDYTEAMTKVYQYLESECILECYNHPVTLTIKYIGREELGEVVL